MVTRRALILIPKVPGYDSFALACHARPDKHKAQTVGPPLEKARSIVSLCKSLPQEGNVFDSCAGQA